MNQHVIIFNYTAGREFEPASVHGAPAMAGGAPPLQACRTVFMLRVLRILPAICGIPLAVASITGLGGSQEHGTMDTAGVDEEGRVYKSPEEFWELAKSRSSEAPEVPPAADACCLLPPVHPPNLTAAELPLALPHSLDRTRKRRLLQ